MEQVNKFEYLSRLFSSVSWTGYMTTAMKLACVHLVALLKFLKDCRRELSANCH